jgi:hypothetical protein
MPETLTPKSSIQYRTNVHSIEMPNREMDTISSVLDTLKLKNQDNEFVINETGQLSLNGKSYSQHDVKIIKTYRFEGESDPADGAIIYLIMAQDGVIGYSLDAYGVYTNHANDGYAALIQKIRPSFLLK